MKYLLLVLVFLAAGCSSDSEIVKNQQAQLDQQKAQLDQLTKQLKDQKIQTGQAIEALGKITNNLVSSTSTAITKHIDGTQSNLIKTVDALARTDRTVLEALELFDKRIHKLENRE